MSAQPFEATNNVDDHGRPAGGTVDGTGLLIRWQNGPLGRVGTDERIEPNGAFVETVLLAVVQRIEHYQEHFPCHENAKALEHIEIALGWLNARTNRRVEQKVEGTHEGN